MKVSIQDYDALQEIGIVALSAYLRGSGWQQTRLIGDRAAIWKQRNVEGEEFEVLVPQKQSLDDYSLRIGQAIHTLSVVEDRSELDTYVDIKRYEESV